MLATGRLTREAHPTDFFRTKPYGHRRMIAVHRNQRRCLIRSFGSRARKVASTRLRRLVGITSFRKTGHTCAIRPKLNGARARPRRSLVSGETLRRSAGHLTIEQTKWEQTECRTYAGLRSDWRQMSG